jgi:hypothetical protein
VRFALSLQLRHILRRERRLPGEELVQHEPERIQIALLRDLTSRQLLRRHVGRRPAAHLGAFELRGNRRQAEVHDPDLARAVDHDVGRLEVPVQHAFRVCRRESRGQLPGDLDPFVHRQPADAPQERSQVFPIHVFHRQVQLAVRLADVVDATDVGMRDLPREAHLAAQARAGRLVDLSYVGSAFRRTGKQTTCRQELQGDRLAELEVVRAVDLAHPTVSQRRDNPEPAGEERAGAEAPFLDHASRRGGRAACGAEAMRGGERRATGRTHARRHERAVCRLTAQGGVTIQQRMPAAFGREHAPDLRQQRPVAATRLLDERAPLFDRQAQRRLEDRPDPPEFVRRHRAEKRGLRHRTVTNSPRRWPSPTRTAVKSPSTIVRTSSESSRRVCCIGSLLMPETAGTRSSAYHRASRVRKSLLFP